MTAAQTTRALVARLVMRWLRHCSRDLEAEGAHVEGVEAARLALAVGRVFEVKDMGGEG